MTKIEARAYNGNRNSYRIWSSVEKSWPYADQESLTEIARGFMADNPEYTRCVIERVSTRDNGLTVFFEKHIRA